MWTPENITALIVAGTGLLGAIVTILRQVQHQADPNAHQDPPKNGSTQA